MTKRKTSWLLAGLLCLAVWPGATQGQSPELMEAYKRYSELYGQGRYQEAQQFAEKAVRLGEQEYSRDHPNTAIFLNNLALLYQAQGRYVEAEPLYQRALEIREKALGPDHPDVAQSLNNLAELYRAQGRYADTPSGCGASSPPSWCALVSSTSSSRPTSPPAGRSPTPKPAGARWRT